MSTMELDTPDILCLAIAVIALVAAWFYRAVSKAQERALNRAICAAMTARNQAAELALHCGKIERALKLAFCEEEETLCGEEITTKATPEEWKEAA